jgi:hypothetical protein
MPPADHPANAAPVDHSARNVVLGLFLLFVLPLSGLLIWAFIRGKLAANESAFLRWGMTTVAMLLFLFFLGGFLIQFRRPPLQTTRSPVDSDSQDADSKSLQLQELGFASLIIGLLALLIMGSGLIIGLVQYALMPYEVPPSRDTSGADLFHYGIGLSALLSPIGLSLAIGGLFQVNRSQDTCWLGIITNGISLFFVAVFLW